MQLRFLMIPLLAAILFGCGDAPATEAVTEAATTTTEVADEPIAVTATSALNIGDTAPDFTLTGTDAKAYVLSEILAENKGAIVTFTCNTCPYAVKYEDRIIKLHEEMAPLGYPVVAIQPNDVTIKPDDGMDAMIQRVKDKNIPYAYLLDAEQSVYPTYGATRTPEIFLLTTDRTLIYHGAIDDDVEGTDVSVNYVKQAIKAYGDGQAIDPADVKAIGCTIKAAK